MIGEYERAFYGGEYAAVAPLFEHYGVQLWTPEVGGRIASRSPITRDRVLRAGTQGAAAITLDRSH